MADISKIKTLDGTTYDIKDTTARSQTSGLKDAAYRDVDTSITTGTTSTKLPTSAAVASYVESSGGGGVTGVKGNAESIYRSGQVNLTPANIGAYAVNSSDGVTTITSSITSVTTGTLSSAKIARYGKVVSIHISFTNTSSVAAGSNVFAATLASAYRPALDWATGGGYYNKASLNLAISRSGAITVRNASAAAVTCSVATNVMATYILP